MSKADWIWMGHGGHFIGGNECRFRLNTKVGNYIVSTVGEYYPMSNADKPYSIGYNRTFETMVFKAVKGDAPCCPFEADVSAGVLEMVPYNTPGDAQEGHMLMCEKYDALDEARDGAPDESK